jgi:transposase-like protein
MTAPYCPLCPGQGVFLGALGLARHYRCRDCGITFMKMQKPRRKP